MEPDFKSYLVRAIYEYCIDHGQVPMISVRSADGIPSYHAHQDVVTLNLSNEAIRDLVITADYVSFSTRFNGQVAMIKTSMNDIVWMGSATGICGMGFVTSESGSTKTAAKANDTPKIASFNPNHNLKLI